MKTPTLQEVKLYFKNAKEVISTQCSNFNLCDYDLDKAYIDEEVQAVCVDLKVHSDIGPENKHLYDYEYNQYAKIISYKDEPIGNAEQLQTPKHYDNSKGTLYKVATERNWNPYLFDIVKRLERAEKKGEFKTDLEKSINVIKLWLNESE
jgi:hypothetical protein